MVMFAVEGQVSTYIEAGSIETYNIKECLALLRKLQNRDSDYLARHENKTIINRLENRIKELVLSK